MINFRQFLSSLVSVCFLTAGIASAQTPLSYPKAQGGEIILPSGAISFADGVVRFDEGNPTSSRPLARQPDAVLGPPDRMAERGSVVNERATLTLGCRGSVTLEFIDNALIDVSGPDLHVWEVGPDVEPTAVEISLNGREWIAVGNVSGSTASIDIAGNTERFASYRYVRLTDVNCMSRGGEWPGADIDAVAAVGTAERFVFEAGLLFAFDEAALSEGARHVLQGFVADLAGQRFSRFMIEGHSDSTGSDAYNLDLSGRRAQAVVDLLRDQSMLSATEMTTRAAGEREPVASNETEEGRQRNRRVEIIVIP